MAYNTTWKISSAFVSIAHDDFEPNFISVFLETMMVPASRGAAFDTQACHSDLFAAAVQPSILPRALLLPP